MTIEGQALYPGEGVKPDQLLQLADEYRTAAAKLLECRRRGKPLSSAPFRLVSIHAIELYLNALLLSLGQTHAEVRGHQHNLSKRVELAVTAKLKLKRRTIEHLHYLCRTREYLVTRYDPSNSPMSQINRLSATLNEVAEKVHKAISPINCPRQAQAEREGVCGATPPTPPR